MFAGQGIVPSAASVVFSGLPVFVIVLETGAGGFDDGGGVAERADLPDWQRETDADIFERIERGA